MNAQSPVPAVIEKADRSAMNAGFSPQAIVPQSFEQAWRFAELITRSGMAPKGFEKPEACMVAILHGLEVGLTPMAALQSIAVVNGRPTVWGDGAIGLVRGSGLCEWIEETIDGEGENLRATCKAKRRGDSKPVTGSFSIADAKKAGLWGKQGPWTQYPKRMLGARARAFCLRDGFADVLRGISIREEVLDIDNNSARDVTPQRPPQQEPSRALTPPRPPAPPKPPAPEPEAEPSTDWPAELESYSNRVSECEIEETLVEIVESYGSVFDDAPDDVKAEARKFEATQRWSIERNGGAA